ncbi:unnamed protein product [Urochloa decumbens]|uniref:FBD domain-containing protein n=1 Tax=Urochloa decumbens TaxID=240449 RepID=A0ABC9GCT3_9POAL
MGVVTRAKKRRRLEGEQELAVDRISGLPDGVLGDIVTLLPTEDGARTQLLSSRWRHLWRSAPLNVGVCIYRKYQTTPLAGIRRILSSYPGPGRCFSIESDRRISKAKLDGWLRSPSLNNLEELEIHYDRERLRWGYPQPLPASVLRFSSTLAVASFKACVFPDCIKNNVRVLHWPVLKKLTLCSVTVSESSLHALLTGCSALESLLLEGSRGFSRVKIMSPSLRSIGVSCSSSWSERDIRLQQLVIEDAPCLERLLFVEAFGEIDISIVSAPRLSVLGELVGDCHIIRFGTTALQGSSVDSLAAVVPGVRVLALSYVKPNAVINLMRCFPHLEKLYIKGTPVSEKNTSHDTYSKLDGTLDIHLRKVVLPYYEDHDSDINFAMFLVRNARLLESMTLELQHGNVGNNAWIRRQRKLLEIEKRASKSARFYFVSSSIESFSPSEEQVHDLSILDPFERTNE